MKQKSITFTLIFGLLTTLSFSQSDLTGTYQTWFDICDRDSKHFSMTLEINSADSVHFIYRDDTQRITANGRLMINNDTISFESLDEKDSEFIKGFFWKSTIWMHQNKEVILWEQHCPEKTQLNIFRKIGKN